MLFKSRSTILLAAASAMAVGISLAAGTASATPTTGWLQTAAGTYNYNTAANWVNGIINGIWDPSLTLTGAQTVTLTAPPATPTGLSFNYTGAYNLTLEATGGAQTLTLPAAAGIADLVGSYKVVAIGESGSNALNIDLGGGTQTFTVGSSSHLEINNVISDGTLALAVAKSGDNGIVSLSGANTYTGVTTIGAGVTADASLANGGLASGVGESSNAAANLIIGGNLTITGNSSTDRLFTVNGSANVALLNSTQTVDFTNTGALAFETANVNSALSLSVNTTATADTLTFNPLITDDGTGKTTLNINASSTGTNVVELANAANSYTGSTNVLFRSSATLEVTKLANGSVASSIGASSSAAGNLTFSAGNTLEYVGTGDSTDRNYTVNYGQNTDKTANTFTIDSSGTGALVMTGSQTATVNTANYPNTNTTYLQLQGTSAISLVNQYNGTIANVSVGSPATIYAFAVNKLGSNTWALGGTNTYTGATTVNGGALLITGSLASGSAVAVNSGGTLGGSGIIGGVVTLTSGGILQPSFDSATPTTLTVGSLSAGTGSTIDLNISGSSNDSVTVTTPGGLTYGGTLAIADALPQIGTYQLFTFTGAATGDFAGVTVNGNALIDPIGTWTGISNGFDFSFVESTGVLTVSGASIPEPATLGLMAVMGVGLLLVGRKRKVA